MTGRRQLLWGLLPLILGAVAAVIFAVTMPGARWYATAAPSLVVVVAGAVLSAGMLVIQLIQRRNAAQIQALERTRQSAAKLRHRFLHRLDHELKNPLTALLTALSSDGDADPRNLQVAKAQADRIRRLLLDLRRVADVETVDLDLQPVDLAPLLGEAVAWAVSDLRTTRIPRIDVPRAPWPLPRVYADADLLLVAVYNVVTNALKFSGPDDVVEVRARESTDPAGVLLEIADTGPGIADAEQQFVWEELARGSAGATAPGSGIGLALVRVVVARHGGVVELRSRPGSGTSVSIALPLDTRRR